MSLQNLPKGLDPIFSEVTYNKIFSKGELWMFVVDKIAQYNLDKKDIYFLVEQKLSGYRPNNKYYVGNEIMFIIKYIEPRTSVQHDVVMDKEICILHPSFFDYDELKKIIEDIKAN